MSANENNNLHSDDLVCLPSRVLAYIRRIPGNLSDSDSDDSMSDTDTDTDESLTDACGRITNQLIPLPSLSAAQATLNLAPTNPQPVSVHNDPPTPVADIPEQESHSNVAPIDKTRDHAQTNPPISPGNALISYALTSQRAEYPLRDLTVLDRLFDTGTVVMRTDASVSNAQCALVERVHKKLFVRRIVDITPEFLNFPNPSTVFEVPSENLNFFCGLHVGDVVVRRNWVGIVNHFEENVCVKFSDSSIACVQGHSDNLFNMDSRTPDRAQHNHTCEGFFYPGQPVRSLPEVWRAAKWLRGRYSGITEGVVISVSLGDVGVEWLAKSLFADNDNESLKPHLNASREIVPCNQLTVLDYFRPSWWTVGDRGFLAHNASSDKVDVRRKQTVNDDLDTNDSDDGWEEEVSDAIIDLPALNTTQDRDTSRRIPRHQRNRSGSRLFQAHRRMRKRSAINEETAPLENSSDSLHLPVKYEDVVQVVATATTVDVLWQDGSREFGVSSLKFRQQIFPDPYDYGPHELVRAAGSGLSHSRGSETNPNNPSLPSSGTPEQEKQGYVVRTYPHRRTVLVRWNDSSQGGEEEVSVYDLKGSGFDGGICDTVLRVPTESSCTWDERKDFVGVIVGQREGKYTVFWHGGTTSDVDHSQLAVLIPEVQTLDEESDDQSDDSEKGDMYYTSDAEMPQSNHDPLCHRDNASKRREVDAARRREMIGNWGTDFVTAGEHENEIDAVEAARRQIGNHLTSTSAGSEHASSRKIDRELLERSVQHGYDKVKDSIIAGANAFAGKGAKVLPVSFGQSAAYLFMSAVVQYILEKDVSNGTVPPLSLLSNTRGEDLFCCIEQFVFGGSRELAAAMMIEKLETILHEACMRSGYSSQGARITSGLDDRLDKTRDDTVSGEVAEDSSNSSIQRFEVIDDLQDFLAYSANSSEPNETASRPALCGRFAKVVNREWQRLRRGLPEGIYVQASEKQQDRLRAYIVGPSGTPYEDVLFMFDILMGDQYPIHPPDVHFHSYGRRINPNLYEDGKVCLSILGTWDGDGVENWDAKNSNLLRLVISLQALVFVDEPYYNEAGYQKQRGTIEGQLNSRMYSETAFLFSLKHIVSSLANPNTLAKDSWPVFKKHYFEDGAAQRIIERCRNLASECSDQKKENSSETGNKNESEKCVNGGSSPADKAPLSEGLCRSVSSMINDLQKVFELFRKRVLS